MSIDVTNTIESVCDEKIEEMTSYYKFTTPKMDAEAKSNLGEKELQVVENQWYLETNSLMF